MTHTLHRKPDNLGMDYVVLVMSAKGITEDGSSPKLRRALEILAGCKPASLGDMRSGNTLSLTLDEILAGVTNRSIVHGVFTRKADLIEALRTLKEAELGMSVVVSGLFEEVFDAARSVGLKPHTVNMSLGVWGKTELLPKDEYMQVSTMCGHGMIPTPLVKNVVQEMKNGIIAADEAAKRLARCCSCGVFNPTRAARIIHKLAEIQ